MHLPAARLTRRDDDLVARGVRGPGREPVGDRPVEPVLGLDEALDSDLVRAREMVTELEQPGVERPVRQLGVPVGTAA